MIGGSIAWRPEHQGLKTPTTSARRSLRVFISRLNVRLKVDVKL
jgi:hypothetical protein